MDFIVQNLIPYLITYKYLALFLIAFIAAFILPIPSGSILMASSALANIGHFNIYWIIILSIIANIAGDNIGYWIARLYGEEVLSKIGFRRILKSKKFKDIEFRFSQHPGFIILASRFEVIFTLSVNLLSGLSKTNYRKYFLHESIGTVGQVLFYSLIGYFFADSWKGINNTISLIMFIIIVVAVFLLIYYWKRIKFTKYN
jgi:membrane-associated protein